MRTSPATFPTKSSTTAVIAGSPPNRSNRGFFAPAAAPLLDSFALVDDDAVADDGVAFAGDVAGVASGFGDDDAHAATSATIARGETCCRACRRRCRRSVMGHRD